MVGYFNTAEKEYVITEMEPRRPLENYLWNEEFLCNVNHFGFGESFLRLPGNARRQLFTQLEATRLVYIKNRENGEVWDINRNYAEKSFSKYQTHVGMGYHKIVSEYDGVNTTFAITVPDKAKAELWQIPGQFFRNEPNPAGEGIGFNYPEETVRCVGSSINT